MSPCGSRVLIAAAALSMGGIDAAHAGPCTAEIAKVERKIHRIQPGPASGPSAPQSIGAQLHHQPTPGSVESAEHKARAEAEAALDRARRADAAGNAAACTRALREAKEVYGLD